MDEWLRKLRSHPRFKRYGVYLLLLIIFLFIAEKIALISDLGFSEEVKEYRWTILFAVLVVSGVGVIANEYRIIRNENNSLSSTINKLTLDNTDLQQQKDSLFRLMEAHKSDAQEDIFNRLKQLAIFSIKREQWMLKAKVERFRIENLSENNSEEINIIDQTTVIINLGNQDNAMQGMQFLIQDPTDNTKYGVIRIEECFDTGSSCSIIETNHPAFWSEIENVNGLMEKKERIIDAPANIIVPYTPFRELNPESAKQIIDWIQNLEEIEL